MKSKAIAILLLSAAVCGCSAWHNSSQQSEASSPQPHFIPDKHQVWQLVSVRGREVSRKAPVVTLIVNDEAGSLSGEAQCNAYHVGCQFMPKADGSIALNIKDITADHTTCPEAVMNAEQRYLQLLYKADAMLVDSLTLTLLQGGREILKYELQ